MALNPFFANETRALISELDQHQDLITEAIQIYGLNVSYLPRTDGRFDRLLGEDAIPVFNTAIVTEMFMETNKGPAGAGDIFSKFGMEIRDSFQFSVSVQQWERVIRSKYPELLRPREGDLIFLDMATNPRDGDFALFEIKWVEHESPFNQLGRRSIYKIDVEMYKWSHEKFETGIDILDNYKHQVGTNKQDFRIQLEAGGEMLMENGTGITFDTTWHNDDADAFTTPGYSRQYGDNDAFQEAAEGLVEFNIENPFGDKF